jgi:hypothetical protein
LPRGSPSLTPTEPESPMTRLILTLSALLMLTGCGVPFVPLV